MSIFRKINQIIQSVGSYDDDHVDRTMYGDVNQLKEHVHSTSKCFPTLIPGILVTAGNPAWTLGDFSNILSTSYATDDYDIHYLNIETLSSNATYELVLYYGPADTECSRLRFTRVNNNEAQNGVFMVTPLIPSGSQLRAKLASSVGAATCNISIMYHLYE